MESAVNTLSEAKELNELHQLRLKRDHAWDELVVALTSYVEARANEAHFAGFLAGRQHETKKMVELLTKKTSLVTDSDTTAYYACSASILSELLKATKQRTTTERRAADVVMDAVRHHPGLNGTELLQKIHASGYLLNENTFRTAIFRLKVPANEMPGPGHIIGWQNGWYAYEDAPQVAIDNVIEARKQIEKALHIVNKVGGQPND